MGGRSLLSHNGGGGVGFPKVPQISAGQVSEDGAMQKFTTLTGVAAPMPLINIDTDMIIPKQFLKTIKRTGLGKNLFDEMRYDEKGNEKPAISQRQDPCCGRQFRLRLLARARALGADGFRHPLRHLHELCRHFL